MRLLVTRPEPDAGETAARLSAMGHEPMIAPMLRIVLAAPPNGLPEPTAIIATSRNGIRAVAPWPIAARWRTTPLFVTGEGTARAARDAGFADVRSGGSDAAAVAARVAGDIAPQAGPVLYVAGRDRSSVLEDRLRGAGYDIRTVEAYRAEPVTALAPEIAAALEAGRIDGVLLFSRRTSEAFRAAVGAAGLASALAATACYAISAQAAEPLEGLVRDIRVAPHPDFDGIAAIIPRAGPPELA